MIIYDPSRMGGWGILFHITGSPLFSYKSLVPAIISATMSAIISNEPSVLAWLEPRVANGNVIFSSIQFLVSLMVINRVREAGSRFNATQQSYLQFYATLISLASLVTACVDNSKKELDPQTFMFRTRFLRWVRALHVLAVEEFQGYESPRYRIGTLLFTEEILLFKERRKPTRLIQWMMNGLMKERSRFGIEGPVDTNIWRLLDTTYSTYANTRRMASQIYPFPLAQGALMCCVCYGLLSPFAFGTMLPSSYFLAPCVAFVSVWLTFAFNFAAEMLEWPFDGRANNLAMRFYCIRFIKDIGTIEFASVSPIISHELDELIPASLLAMADELDYALPRKRPFQTKKDINEWLKKAQEDVVQFSGKRKFHRTHLQPVDPLKRANEDEILGAGVTEMRAQGVFRVLW